MDRVFLRGLQVEAKVGLLDWELTQTQVLQVDCEITIDTAPAALTDHIGETLDYAALRESIHQFCGGRRVSLLETLADQLSAYLLARFESGQSVILRLTKPTIFSDADGAGVEVHRHRA